MSTKTLRKRIALVAVSALGFGLLSAAPSSAATVAGTVSPIRVTTGDTTPNGQISWTVPTGVTYAGTETAVVTLTTAPTSSAKLRITADTTIGDAPVFTDNAGTAGTASLGTNSGSTITVAAGAAGSTAKLAISVNTAGRYIGSIRVAGGAVDDTVTFDFTTTGAVASYTFTSDVTATAVSGAIATTITLRDAAGNITQPARVDTFALTASTPTGGSAGTFATPSGGSAGILTATASTADSLFDGTATLAFTNSATAAATSVLTATPRGTLGTLAAQTLNVSTTAASSMATAVASVATSTTAVVNATATVAAPSLSAMNAYTVDQSQTSVTFNVAGLTPSTAVTYSVTSSTSSTIAVNGGSAADRSGASALSVTTVASATGTLAVTVVATTPGTQTITLDLNAGTTNVAGQVNAQYTYAAPAYTVVLTSPTATSLAVLGSTQTFTGVVRDQFGNLLGGATVTATGSVTPSGTALTSSTATSAAGAFSLSLTPAATTTVITTTVSAVKTGISIASASAHTTNLTATGIAATLVLTDNDTVATGITQTDNISSRTVPLSPAARSTGGVIPADNWVRITPQTTVPASIAYSVTATNGIRLSLTDPNASGASVITTAQTAAVTSTGGTAFYATPTQVGTGVITVVSGGLTQTFTLTGTLSASAKAQLVTLTAGTNANGKAAYTVTTTDIFGNVVAADVNIAMSGAGYLSNGFKNMTLSTLATNGSNSFDVISDGSAASGITATVASASYTAVSADQATAQGISVSVQSATASVTVVQPVVPAKSAELLAIEAIQAKAAADKIESDAKIALLQAALDAAATKAAADKLALEKAVKDAADAAATKAAADKLALETAIAASQKAAADAIAAAAAKAAADTAAAQAAAVAAAEAAADAAAEAIDAGNNAYDAATSAGEAADAATAAAEQAGEDATAAANAAGEAAVAAAEAATEAAAEATDAANAATDAANASAEAADAATAAAQDAADAVAALSTQVSEMISALKKQITALTNLVIKIQKKVKA
jgi:hypothetical protein